MSNFNVNQFYYYNFDNYNNKRGFWKMKKFIIGVLLGIIITVSGYNLFPDLYSQLSTRDSSSLGSIASELRSIRRVLESIQLELKFNKN